MSDSKNTSSTRTFLYLACGIIVVVLVGVWTFKNFNFNATMLQTTCTSQSGQASTNHNCLGFNHETLESVHLPKSCPESVKLNSLHV